MTTITDELGMVMIETDDDALSPVTLAPGDDPIPVLLSMRKFLAGEDRGLCEIVVGCGENHPPSKLKIGIVALISHPEKTAMPIFDTRTREIACVELAAWLKERGFEASACRWDRLNPGMVPMVREPRVRWRLVTGKPEVPPLPPELKPAVGLGALGIGGLGEGLGQAFGGGLGLPTSPHMTDAERRERDSQITAKILQLQGQAHARR